MSFVKKLNMKFLKIILMLLCPLEMASAQNVSTNEPIAGAWHDQQSGLTWQVCPVGATFFPSADRIEKKCSSTTEEGRLTFNHAAAEAIKNNLGGFTDWRMPTAQEFRTLTRLQKPNSCIQEVLLIGPKRYWMADALRDPDKVYTIGANVRSNKQNNSIECGELQLPSPSSFSEFKSMPREILLLRGGVAGNDWLNLVQSNPVQTILANEKKTLAAGLDAYLKLKQTSVASSDPTTHPLATSQPSKLSSNFFVDRGSLEPIDWYVGGLKAVEKLQKSLRKDFQNYLLKRRLFDYKVDFSSPFDKSDFEKELGAEKTDFVDRLFNLPTEDIPQKLVSFTPIVLEGYAGGILKISTCRDLGLYNNFGQNGMRCGGAGAFISSNNLIGEIKKIASQGPLASAGRVKPIEFASFFSGDNNGAPVYILNHGLPATIEIKTPENTARALYDMAKSTKVRPEYASQYGGKMLSAKITYGPPKIKGFGASNSVQKTLFVTFTGGAVIEYETPATSVCIFDGVGQTPLFCSNLN